MTIAIDQLKPGDVVTWMHVTRGGYGFATPVEATIVRVFRSTVRIRVRLADGSSAMRRVALSTLRASP